jgi:NhaA family Na+:H+ antiporter
VTRILRFAVDHYVVVPLGVVVALLWANTAPESYYQVAEGLAFVVNDIGMAFALALLVQEAVEAIRPGGTLHPWRRGALPIVAAAGGTLGAIAAYHAVLSTGDQSVLVLGWPVAAAVDIAVGFFATRSIFGRHPAVTFFLLLALASDTIGLLLVSQRTAGVSPGVIVFIALAAAATIGLRRSRVAARVEQRFRYPVQVILFLFALVNGGVLLRGVGIGTWAVVAAALVGRPAGILVATGLAVAAGLRLPHRLGWREAVVIAFAAASGFTFALFFAAAVVPVGPVLLQTKMGALVTIAGTLLAFAAARLLHVGRFADRDVRGC